jgi:hypothetical protein
MNLKPFSRSAHGMLDYLTVGTLLALPRVMRLNRSVTGLLTGAAVSTLIYSLLTRYELGLVKTLPFSAHLSLDALSGVSLATAPMVMRDTDADATALLLGLGLFEIMAVLMTNPNKA